MFRRFLSLVLPLFLLSGCSSSVMIENQAYAVSLGIDYEDDIFTLSVQVPSISGKSGGSGQEDSSSGYQLYSASSEEFLNAYSTLQASLPQQLNLSLLKSIVFSEAFARSDLFKETIRTMIHIFSLSGNAAVIITRKNAKELLENQKPHIGMRLSVTVPGMLEYKTASGYIVTTSLSSLYASLESVYSTALCALADTAVKQKETGSNETLLAGELLREGENKNEYMGCAIFDRERMKGYLDGYETQLIKFLRGNSFADINVTKPESMRLSARRKPKVDIDFSQHYPTIRITIYLTVSPLIEFPDIDALSEHLENEFCSIIRRCQQMNAEPFGFSETAAKSFLTSAQWSDYDWLHSFSQSEVFVSVNMIGEK